MAFTRARDGVAAFVYAAVGWEDVDLVSPTVGYGYASIEDAIADAQDLFPDESEVRGELLDVGSGMMRRSSSSRSARR